jgi:hypothetical protein
MKRKLFTHYCYANEFLPYSKRTFFKDFYFELNFILQRFPADAQKPGVEIWQRRKQNSSISLFYIPCSLFFLVLKSNIEQVIINVMV